MKLNSTVEIKEIGGKLLSTVSGLYIHFHHYVMRRRPGDEGVRYPFWQINTCRCGDERPSKRITTLGHQQIIDARRARRARKKPWTILKY